MASLPKGVYKVPVEKITKHGGKCRYFVYSAVFRDEDGKLKQRQFYGGDGTSKEKLKQAKNLAIAFNAESKDLERQGVPFTKRMQMQYNQK